MSKRSDRSHTQRARRRPPGLAAALLGVAAACVYAATMLLGGATGATAAPVAPAFLGEILEPEVPIGSWSYPEGGVATESASGDVYIGASERLIELTPYGAFVREIGHEVDKTKVQEREAQEAAKEPVTVTSAEEDLCTAVSKDTCGAGRGGSQAGDLGNVDGVAVEQGTGAVYALADGRVNKFAKNGSFVWAVAKEVDKTKVEERKKQEAAKETVTVTAAEENICTAASGDECQEGRTGSAPGEFESEPQAIGVGGAAEHVYVGDKGKVQVFDSAGGQVEEESLSAVSTSANVKALAVDGAGDVFAYQAGVAGVHELEPGGALSGNVFDASSTSVYGLAVDGSGHLFVGDRSSSWRVLEYEVASPSAAPAEFGDSEPGKIEKEGRNFGLSLGVDSAGTVYATEDAGPTRTLMFGSLAAMQAKYGAPAVSPSVGGETASGVPGSGEETLQAEVNSQFAATTYQFQYGSEPCSGGGCMSVPATPIALGELTKTAHTVTATVGGLDVGHNYYFRAVATNATGTAVGPEVLFTVPGGFLEGTPGLPDGRRYELVSPPDKNGNSVYPDEEFQFYSLAAANGNALLFEGSGAMGVANSSVTGNYVATRTPAGWSTRSATPPALAGAAIAVPERVVPSSSFSKFLFIAQYGEYSREEPLAPEGSVNIFLSEAPGAEPLWLGKPTISDPFPEPGHTYQYAYQLDGASADLSTVYFSSVGTLVPQDSSRAKHIGQAKGEGGEPWGFYEWHDGVLSPAGVLPDGNVSEWGAIPPHIERSSFQTQGTMPDYFNNQVSEDGTKAFFVSPDPTASSVSNPGYCAEADHLGDCTSEAPQLYLRETLSDGSKRTVLVSQSQLPGQEGQPAAHGPMQFDDPVGVPSDNGRESESYVYATPDGGQAFFFSIDRLTSAAPGNEEPKMYDFDTETGVLTYLPGVDGSIAAVAPDGSDFIFEDKTQSPAELKLWTVGPNGGSVRPIAQLPIPENANGDERLLNIDNARASENGSVFVFGTNAQIPGGFNDGGGFWQMYRYSAAGGELDCVSCPPHNQQPVGNAEASYANSPEATFLSAHSTINTRVMSSNGELVFFDSPNPLVAQASNGRRDVYEWEDGHVYLISSGTSAENSYIMDSSASGHDVFFSTSAGLVPQDTDGAYDVYDARVPHPGDTPPPTAVPCEGAVCQGPASTPELLGAPASATFSGAGNLTPTAAKQPTHTAVKHRKRKQSKKKRPVKRRRGSKARKPARHTRGTHAGRSAGVHGHGHDGRGK